MAQGGPLPAAWAEGHACHWGWWVVSQQILGVVEGDFSPHILAPGAAAPAQHWPGTSLLWRGQSWAGLVLPRIKSLAAVTNPDLLLSLWGYSVSRTNSSCGHCPWAGRSPLTSCLHSTKTWLLQAHKEGQTCSSPPAATTSTTVLTAPSPPSAPDFGSCLYLLQRDVHQGHQFLDGHLELLKQGVLGPVSLWLCGNRLLHAGHLLQPLPLLPAQGQRQTGEGGSTLGGRGDTISLRAVFAWLFLSQAVQHPQQGQGGGSREGTWFAPG